MSVISKEKLVSKITDFVRQQGSCLFAGAGVGKRAGLPLWAEYLEYLGSVADRYEQETAALIRKRLRAGHYLEGVELYKICIEIPEGEKYRELSSPFISPPTYSPNNLRALMALPFSAAVTTNFDRSLHDAYVSLFDKQEESGLTLKAPQFVELGDLSMRHAIYWTDFYIARVHGRAEIPETMVLDRNDYHRTEMDPFYQEFLLHILKTYHCLFIGYSFIDPAINRIFNLMKETLPLPHQKLHLALLPSDSDSKLRVEFARYNIEMLEYNPANNHECLWESIREAQREIRTLPRKAPYKVETIPGLGRFVASCYSRFKLRTKAEPLHEIVMEGIVAQAIIDSGLHGTTKQNLVQSLKNYLSLTENQLDYLVTRVVEGLITKGLCHQSDGNLLCQADSARAYDNTLEALVESVTNRLKVREGVDADETLRKSITEILNRLLLARGWDLGAHFAGGHPSSTFEAWSQIQAVLESIAKDISPTKSKPVANAIFDFFKHPEDKEAEMLSDVGRIAFGVELVLNNARSTVMQVPLIPELIYLDANVLMPAIVEGHPYSPVYADAVSRVTSTGDAIGRPIRVFTAKGFLNEIINHRSLAIQEIHEQGLEKADKLHRHILMYGSENTNVYIAAYASWVGRTGEIISFSEFLRRVAPYGSEEGLAQYLEEHGIQTITLSFASKEEMACFNKVRQGLHQAYEDAAESTPTPYFRRKPPILIEHEAAQLARLILDMEDGRKPLFVTADKRLMELCRGEILGHCANAIVSHVGFIQLVDLVLGIDTDKRALARLFWSVELTVDQTTIRNYLIDLALQHYDEAMAMAMWEVVDSISEEAAQATKQEGILTFPGSEENRTRFAAFLDRFEQDFFKKMAEVIRKKEKM